ncbi:hypothetical protein HJG60_011863 [Phyllostomus discolor]|uniref:Uncharacterized protein n=1 Tax=Phyllostomus discolor TaxID=89673 RepID=A0A834DSS1_9CHIR|nr:hypothetical protein HJG60_011863 [Phyllostomus discolor]
MHSCSVSGGLGGAPTSQPVLVLAHVSSGDEGEGVHEAKAVLSCGTSPRPPLRPTHLYLHFLLFGGALLSEGEHVSPIQRHQATTGFRVQARPGRRPGGGTVVSSEEQSQSLVTSLNFVSGV